jgi:tight adherence protein B
MVGYESAEPIAGEFKATFDEIRFGMSTRTALLNLAERVPLSDMRYFVLAMVIQLETGGNFTELLGVLSRLIRERFSLMGKIKVLATEGKLSAYILTILPFAVAGVLQLVNPQYMKNLYQDPAGLQILIGALLMMGAGVLWMFRIIKIRI